MPGHQYFFGFIFLALAIGLGSVPLVYTLSFQTAAKVIDYADQSLSEPAPIRVN